MRERLLMAGGAIIIAGVSVVVGVIIARPLHDVNPIGFHAEGQVQINGGSSLDTSTCSKNGACTLRFDFSTNEDGNTPEDLPCAANSNCLSFSGPTVMIAGSPDGLQTPEVVNGRVMVVLQSHR
jgi:hypothetical protein